MYIKLLVDDSGLGATEDVVFASMGFAEALIDNGKAELAEKPEEIE